MSASTSTSEQTTATSYQTISDSYNSTYNKVFNLSNVSVGNTDNSGNVNIALPNDNQTQILPYILGFLGIAAFLILFRT